MVVDNLTSLRGLSVLITGADGMLGRAFAEAIQHLSPETRVDGRPRSALDVTDEEQVMQLTSERPDIIVHCAGLTNADECDRDPENARRVHLDGTRNVTRLASAVGAQILYPQSVFIFNGEELPVTEFTTPAPPFVYGLVKLEAEQHVLKHLETALVVRMAGFFGGDEKDKNFVGQFTRTLKDMLYTGETDICVGDRVWQPSYTLNLASNCLLLLARRCRGIYHMGSLGEATFYEVAVACVDSLGLSDRIQVTPSSSQPFERDEVARRPRRMVTRTDRLDAEELNRQGPWRESLHEYLQRPYFDPWRYHDDR
jgi:dTDP-4-dehydrorhamnose reductase